MRLCHLINKQITIRAEIPPRSWANISNFHALPPEDQRTHGWYPYELVTAPAGKVVTGSTVEILGDRVVETETWTDPPPPEEIAERIPPRWLDFSTALMADPAVNTMLGAVLAAAPGLYGGLTVGLNEASKGDTRLFLSAWGAAQQQGFIDTALAAAVQTQAGAHDLPAEFVGALLPTPPAATSIGQEWTAPDGTLWRVVQARDGDGQFTTDDPDTPDRESLTWAEVTDGATE